MNYTISTSWTIVLILLAVWELAWKGLALWKAARNSQRGWFIALLFINSAGILPIIYLSLYTPVPDFKKRFNHNKLKEVG